MSVAQREPQLGLQKSDDLRSRLIREWLHPQEGASEPIIIEETAQYYDDLLHFYVIWAEWSQMPQRDRSEVILRAYEDSHPNGNGKRVSIAMGLTAEEARHMGIIYAPLDAAA